MKIRNQLNVVFVGCGRIAGKHYQAIMQNVSNGISLVGVADIDLAKCAQYVHDEGIKATSDFKSSGFFNNAGLCVILSESGNHYDHAKYALNAGLDVLIEKPVTLRLDHAHELKSLARQLGRKVYVVKQNRFNEPILRAQQFVDDGFLGTPQIASVQVRWCREQAYYDLAEWRGTWAMDGGVISNQASHHIDLMRWFLGPVKSVQAVDRRFGVEIETEDTVIALLEFTSGAVGTLEATTSTRPRNLEGSFSVQGSKGSFEVGGFAVNEMRYMESNAENFSSKIPSSPVTLSQNTNDVYGSGHAAVYREIIKDQNGIKNNAVTIDDAIQTLELIHMIYRSIEIKQKIQYNDSNFISERMGFK